LGGYFWKRNVTYEAGITIDRDLPHKINNSNDYSPTNKRLFCLLKLLTTDFESKSNWGTSQDRMR
jgi:hypothetical protein